MTRSMPSSRHTPQTLVTPPTFTSSVAGYRLDGVAVDCCRGCIPPALRAGATASTIVTPWPALSRGLVNRPHSRPPPLMIAIRPVWSRLLRLILHSPPATGIFAQLRCACVIVCSIDMPRPLLAVSMPSYHAARSIAEPLASVLTRTVQDWELIIVHDTFKRRYAGCCRRGSAAHPAYPAGSKKRQPSAPARL